MTEFRVLGPLEVRDGGEPLPITSRRQRVLLCRLLLDANRAVSSDALFEALWGERPPPTAAKALQGQVVALRGLLGRELIATVPGGYRLDAPADVIDVARFERALGEARRQLAAGDATAAAATWREALALQRGRPFDDIADQLASGPEIARLEALLATAREDRIDADLALARHHELVGELEALVQADPLRERLQGQLMLALYRAGRQAEALEVYRRARRALRDGAGLDPGPELRELQRAILEHDPGLAVEPPELRARRHLPAPPTGLVGRASERAELDAALRRGDARLVTLTGPGGTGKTRLALAVAHGLADAYPDGVYFVDLAHLREPALVPSTIAHALGVEEHGERPLAETLLHVVGDRRLLLLLDNFEVIDQAAPVVADLLAAAPGLAVLATSQSPLRLRGEREERLGPLPLDDAIALFTARAAAVAPRFRRPDAASPEVAEICRRLDRLPLALELAAARTREYAAGELLALLPGAIELATGGARDLPERQRTLRATIDWSHDLLAPAEQGLFARLAVLNGGCTPAAAAAICGARRDELAALASRSLLLERPGADGGPRFAMLETVREYALERLAAGQDAEAARRRHAEHFAGVAERAAEASAVDATTLPLLDDDHDNLRAAVTWSHDAGAVDLELRLVAALARYWVVRGHLREGQLRLAAALAHADDAPAPLRASALAGDTLVAHSLGDYTAMRRAAERALELYRSVGDERGVAWSLQRLGTARGNQGDLDAGIPLLEKSIACFRTIDDERGLASALNNLASALLARGDAAAALPLFEESVEVFRRLGRPHELPVPLSNLGLAALLQGRHADALQRFDEGVALAEELRYTEAVAYGLEGLAAALAGLGDHARAATVLGAAETAAATVGITLEPLEQRIHDETVAQCAGALGPQAFADATAAGRALGPADARACAVEALRGGQSTQSGHGSGKTSR